jgi:hypothetical protein
MPAPGLKVMYMRKDPITAEQMGILCSFVNDINSPDRSIDITYDLSGIRMVVNPEKIAGAETITVVTAVRFESVSGKFQIKTREIIAVPAEDESDWTDVVGTTACT